LNRRADEHHYGAISSNFTYFFPEQFVAHVETLALSALGRVRIDWRPQTIALALLHCSTKELSWSEAMSVAAEIDEVVRWRPAQSEHFAFSASARQLLDSPLWRESGPLTQRAQAVAAVRSGSIAMPTDVYFFGLGMPPGGRAFLEIVMAVAAQSEVHALLALPNPSPQGASWLREAIEARNLWEETGAHISDLAHPHNNETAWDLERLQSALVQGGSFALRGDGSVRVIGAYGISRQAEVARDVILAAISKFSLELHEILVVSPRPEDFESAIDRHWHYERGEEGVPRLPYEMVETSAALSNNRAYFVEVLLACSADYLTTQHIEKLLWFDCVRRNSDLREVDVSRLIELAKLGKVSFGLDAEHRSRFGLYESGADQGIGTWRRFIDRLAETAMMPNLDDPDQLGEASDVALAAALNNLLKAVRHLVQLRDADLRLSLGDWRCHIDEVLKVAVGNDSPEVDDSVIRAWNRVLSWADSVGDPTVSMDTLLGVWREVVESGARAKTFGARGVHVASLTTMPAAKYRYVVVLGLDEERLPAAILRSKTLLNSEVGDPNPRRSMLGALLQNVLSASDGVAVVYNSRNEQTGQGLDVPIVIAELLQPISNDEIIEETSRHGFAHVQDQHAALPTFDTRAQNLADAHLARGKQSAGEVLRSGAIEHSVDEPLDTVSLGDLLQLAKNAASVFVRSGLRASLPPDCAEEKMFPVLDLDKLERHQILSEIYDRAFALWGFTEPVSRAKLEMWLDEILTRESVAAQIPDSNLATLNVDRIAATLTSLQECLRDFVDITEDDARRMEHPIDVEGRRLDLRVGSKGLFNVHRGFSKSKDDFSSLSTFRFEVTKKEGIDQERDLLAMMLECLALKLVSSDVDGPPVAMSFFKSADKDAYVSMVGVRFTGSAPAAATLLGRFMDLGDVNHGRPMALTRTVSSLVLTASEKRRADALRKDLQYNSLEILFPENIEQFEALMERDGVVAWLEDAMQVFDRIRETSSLHKKRDQDLAWVPMVGAEESSDGEG
jgi:hypothetical protein